MRKLFILCLSIFYSMQLFANTLSTTQAQTYQDLLKEIRCVVCQNQNLADSNAMLAIDLKKKIYNMISQQQSPAEIKQYLVKRYGEFILLKPRFSTLTVALWFFPFAALLAGFGAVFIFAANRRTKNLAQHMEKTQSDPCSSL